MNSLIAILVALALVITQALAGGREIILCVPAYSLLALGAVLSWWPLRRTPIPRAAIECLTAATLFCTYVCIRAIFSPEEDLARHDLFVALGTLALYLLVALSITSTRLRLLLVGALLALAFADCAIGAVQHFKTQNFMPFPFLPRHEYGTRASGFYGYPNHLAGFLEMALGLGLSVAFWSRWPLWARVLAGYVSVMSLLGILFTGSRGGYIATAVGLMVFVVLSLVLVGMLASGRVLGVTLVGVVVIAGAVWGVRQVMARSALVQARASQTLTVDASRMQLWQAAWKQFRLQPIVGTGSGTYLYYGRQFRNPAIHKDPVHAHNDYFELLAEYGILGLVAAVIFLETHLRHGWNSLTAQLSRGSEVQGMGGNSLALTVGALSASASCLTHSLLDFNLHMPANVLTAAIVFALLATPGEGSEAAEEEPGWPASLRLALPVLGIGMALCIFPTAPAEYYAERVRAILADWHHSASPELDVQMEELARRGLAWDPRNPQLYSAIGDANSTQGDLATDPAVQRKFDERSVEAFRTALARAPGDVGSVLVLGAALDNLEHFSESEPLFARALQLDPNGGVTHIKVAHHLLLQGKYAEAAEEFRLGYKFGAWEAAEAGLKQIDAAQKAKGGNPSPAPSSPKEN